MGPSEHPGEQLGDHLFRRESGRMVATLTRIFGVHNLALAEDVVQDAFCRALEVWKFRGVPENPSAWLMITAKNRALDVLRRERTGKLVKGKQKTITDGPFAEAKDVIGGYSLIEARDLDQAVELSKGCPIFEFEGAVEVRPVLQMNM